MKKIAIMGARGFVGKNLTEFFQHRYEVYPLTRKELDILETEEVRKFFLDHKIDVVFNCMNQGGSRKDAYDIQTSSVIGNNLKMFFNVEQCISPEMKMINFGSGAEYNKHRDLNKIEEIQFGQSIPEDDYGYSKYVMSKYITAKHASNIYEPVIFGLYGKYEDYTYKFVSNAIIKNLLQMPIVINQNVIFDYLYIGDFLKIMERLVEQEMKWKTFHITPTDSIDLIRIAELINELSSYKSEIIIRNKGLNYQYTGNNRRLRENMGDGFSFTSYREGIAELFRYYEENLNKLDVDAIREDMALKYCKTKE